MIIHYADKKLEKILTDKRLIKKYYSNDFTRICNRLSEMKAANNLGEIPEVPPPRRHKLSGNMRNCWGIDYSRNDRFIICPYGNYDINDLATVTEIEILDLDDYH